MRFKELRLAEPIVCAVAAEGYTAPTPIQTKAIPSALAGKDVLGCAQTGSGKTGAFALPILHRLASSTAGAGRRNRKGPRGRRPRALVLCPTRELATQIFESFGAYGRNLALRHAVVFGGVSQARQVRDLRAGIDVLVATPGRLLDLIGQGFIDLGAIEVLVLDEADRMLDMGFIRDIRRVVERLPSRRQTLLFSATMPAEIRRLADSILHRPISVQTSPEGSTVEEVSQFVYLVARKNKPILLARLLRHRGMGRTLVFTRTKHGADKLVRILRRSGIEVGAIHGNKTQNARTRALDGFKSGEMPVLVATDIASRGIDVDEITHVVNFDIPNVPETYIHRIGRTARAGASGIALSFCDHEELDDLRAIERLIRMQLEVIEDTPDLAFDAPTTHRKRSGHQSPPKRLRPHVRPRVERVVASIDETNHPRVLIKHHDRWASRASRTPNPADGGTTGASPGVTTPRKFGDSALKIYVGNMSFDTNEDSLRNAFAEHGDVEEIAVITDRDTGRPRGFAFVTMPDSAARAAIDALNGKELDGRTLNVSEARAKTDRGGGGGGGGGGGPRRGGW